MEAAPAAVLPPSSWTVDSWAGHSWGSGHLLTLFKWIPSSGVSVSPGPELGRERTSWARQAGGRPCGLTPCPWASFQPLLHCLWTTQGPANSARSQASSLQSPRKACWGLVHHTHFTGFYSLLVITGLAATVVSLVKLGLLLPAILIFETWIWCPAQWVAAGEPGGWASPHRPVF